MLTFEASPAVLAKGLAAIAGVTNGRNTIPILHNVHLDGQTARRHVVARVTDMDMESTVEIEASIRDSGRTTVSHRQLCRLAGSFRESASIELRHDEEAARMHVSAALRGLDLGLDDGTFKATVRTLPPEEFPAMRPFEVADTVRASAGEWLKVLDGLRPFISTEETRYYLNGINLTARGGWANEPWRWEAAATNGHILGRVRFGDANASTARQTASGVIVPRSAVLHMIQRLRLVPAGDEVTMDIGEGGIFVRFPGSAAGSMASKVIDGTFPDYARVIPDRTNRIAEIDCRRLGKVVRAALGASGATTPAANISLGAASLMTFTLADDQGDDPKAATAPLPIRWTAGDIEVGMNLRLLTGGLSMMDGADAVMQVSDAQSPVRFDAVAPADGIERTAVAMPMRA
jgi:DNA polymerase-3 subunit beta